MQQALPVGGYGVLRVVPPAVLESALKKQDQDRAAASAPSPVVLGSLASHVRSKYQIFRLHRNNAAAGWSERLLIALRAFNGQYDSNKLAEIRKFGGSEVYARMVAMKCRGASALLRDVYLSQERAWGLQAPVDPKIPPDIIQSIQHLLEAELNTLQTSGQPADPGAIRDRTMDLMEGARQAAKKKAAKQAGIAEDKLDELLTEGGFYKALAEFIADVPLFPFACIKGPEVKIVPQVTWEGNGGRPLVQQKPKLFWKRVSPFDLYFTPGVSDIEDAEVIERLRVTRADLNDLLDLPGYNADAIRRVLEQYGTGGLVDNWDNTDAERAVQENRENPQVNRSGMISCLEYHGNIQGKMLLDYGMDASQVPDPLRDYMVQAWLIGPEIIKVQMSPSPRKRHPYFITSFEKVPGTPVGNGLPDIISDLQEVCNATLRTLVNNMSIASGPQVVVDISRLAPDEDADELYPWKRWHVQGGDPVGGNNAQAPVSFFMPTSNAQELLSVYNQINQLADDISGIPKYLSGQAPGGAGRTASGLAMLMGNASKLLQTVAANIDRDVIDPALSGLFDLIMLTDTSGLLSGEEEIVVKGVNVAIQRETERSRAIEFLQVTANPIDAQIVGPKGRAACLRVVADKIGIPGEEIVPSEEELEAQQKAQQMQQTMAAAGAQAQGSQQGPSATQDMGPRTNTVRPIAGGVG